MIYAMGDVEVTVWECVSCGGRGWPAAEVRHVVTCSARGELLALTFTLSAGVTPPLFCPPGGAGPAPPT